MSADGNMRLRTRDGTPAAFGSWAFWLAAETQAAPLAVHSTASNACG